MNRIKNSKQEIRTVTTPHGSLSYLLTRKKVKNVNLRIDRDGQIKVSAAPRVPVGFIDDFVREKEAFIRRAIAIIHSRQQEKEISEFCWETGSMLPVLGQKYPLIIQEGKKEGIMLTDSGIRMTIKPETNAERKEAIWRGWQKKLAKEVLEESLLRIGETVAPYGIGCTQLSLRRMTSRWGSCQPGKGKITLNIRLVEAPTEAIDYVVLHELTHMKYPHHQKEFYDFIAHIMPDWKERKAMLKGII